MQRSDNTPLNNTHEEWTKYFVNDIECAREAIYQTILDQHLYTGTVEIEKKYLSKTHEEESENSEDGFPFSFKSSTSDVTDNLSSSFKLETKKFIEKFSPESNEFQLLVDKMLNVVEMFYEAENDYNNQSKNLRLAIRDCMDYFLVNLTDSKAPYNDILHNFSLAYFEFLFDLAAYALSKAINLENDGPSKKMSLPNMAFDTSGIKEKWDEQWKNRKKAHYLDKYLSFMLTQADVLHERCIVHELFADTDSREVVDDKFEKFKQVIESIQHEKACVDKAQHRRFADRILSLFHDKKHPANEPSSPASVQTENVGVKL